MLTGNGNLPAATLTAHSERKCFALYLFWDCYDVGYYSSQTGAQGEKAAQKSQRREAKEAANGKILCNEN